MLVTELDDVRGHAETGHECARATFDQQLDDLLQRLGKGRQEIDAEGLLGQFLRRGDLRRESRTRHRRGTQTAVAAGVRDRGDERAVGDTTHAGSTSPGVRRADLGESCLH